MSEIFSDIRYVPLETTPDCLLGYINIPVYGKDIIIRSSTGSINGQQGTYRFSDTGKFLNKVGTIGRGPEEHYDNCNIVITGDTIFVVSCFTDEIVSYSLEGNFIRKYHISIKARPKSIVRLKDNSFMVALSNLSEHGILIKTDENFKLKKGYIKHVPFDDNPLPFGFQKTKEKTYFFYNYLDTIYDVSKGYPVPCFVIDYGKFKTSDKKRSVYEKHNSVLNRPNINDFDASNYYLKLYFYYPFNETLYTLLYRISDGKQITWTDLINDIDHGTLERWTGVLSDNTIVYWLLPNTIISRYQKMTLSEKQDPKNSGFVKMAANITPESNPVLMICTLK